MMSISVEWIRKYGQGCWCWQGEVFIGTVRFVRFRARLLSRAYRSLRTDSRTHGTRPTKRQTAPRTNKHARDPQLSHDFNTLTSFWRDTASLFVIIDFPLVWHLTYIIAHAWGRCQMKAKFNEILINIKRRLFFFSVAPCVQCVMTQ